MSFDPTPDEIADAYAGAYARVTTLASGFGADECATPVPGTPKWTIHGLLSHLVGGPADLAAGRFEGAGGEEWTQRQVDQRVECGLEQILEEWDGIVATVDGAVRAGQVPIPVSYDVLTHESDLRAALGLPPTPDAGAIRFIAAGFASRASHVVGKRELTPVEFVATDTGWRGGTPGGITAATTEYEWTRALTGRRSNAQVAAYDWSDDPAPYLDLLSPFGPLREADVEE